MGDREVVARSVRALGPADGELAGAGTGMLCAGPVADHFGAVRAALG